MASRPLTPFEQPIAAAVLKLGSQQRWEFAAFLATSMGPLIEIRTVMRHDGVDPSLDVLQKAGSGGMVCHHNHLSHESLSSADWRGLVRIFNETWAYCEDGTRYYGRVLDINSVERVLRKNYQALEAQAENDLFSILSAQGHSEAVTLAPFFRKEVLNRAMLLRDMVAYEFEWGTIKVPLVTSSGLPPLTSNAGHYGRTVAAEIDQAAARLAPAL